MSDSDGPEPEPEPEPGPGPAEFDDEAELDGLETFDIRQGIRPQDRGDPDAPGEGGTPAPSSGTQAHLGPGSAVRLRFPRADTYLDVPLGGELRLGRDSSWAPEAALLLKGEPTVSEQHAVVTCAEDGTLSVTEVPRGSRNGVKVDSRDGTRTRTRVLGPGEAEPLKRNDTVWLGPKVSFTVQDPMGVLEP